MQSCVKGTLYIYSQEEHFQIRGILFILLPNEVSRVRTSLELCSQYLYLCVPGGHPIRAPGSRRKVPCLWRITHLAPGSAWNTKPFIAFGVHRVTCSPVFLASASSPGDLFAPRVTSQSRHVGWEKFAWPALKNLSRFEIKQNLNMLPMAPKRNFKKKAWFSPGSCHPERGTKLVSGKRANVRIKQRTEMPSGALVLGKACSKDEGIYFKTQVNCWAQNNDSMSMDKTESNWRRQRQTKIWFLCILLNKPVNSEEKRQRGTEKEKGRREREHTNHKDVHSVNKYLEVVEYDYMPGLRCLLAVGLQPWTVLENRDNMGVLIVSTS